MESLRAETQLLLQQSEQKNKQDITADSQVLDSSVVNI